MRQYGGKFERRLTCEDYYKKSAKDRTAIASALARFGMTEPELYANVFAGNSEVLQMFERMIAARKEDERRRRWQERQEIEAKLERRTNGQRKTAQG